MRTKGMIPAVVYGRGTEPVLVGVDGLAMKKALSTPAGANVLLDLFFDGDGKNYSQTVMAKQLQKHPIKKEMILHADFIRISMTEKIEVRVPLNLRGEPAGVQDGGAMQIQMREVSVRCFPGDIPEYIDVPVDELQVGQVLTAGEIQIPFGSELIDDPAESVVSILAPQAELEEQPEGEEAPAEGPASETNSEQNF